MASKASIQRECDKRNEARNVVERHSYRMDQFWNGANKGAFLISDGDPADRESALLSKIAACIYGEKIPTIILNASDELENKLIEQVVSSTDTNIQLQVISPNYKYYQVFYGMSHEAIVDYLFDVASRTMDGAESGLRNYMNAFLYILESCCTPTLTDMLNLIEYNDYQIRDLGKKMGVEKKELDALLRYADCGETFRYLIKNLAKVFGVITTEDCDTSHSVLGTELTDKTVFLITLRSGKPYILNHYFAIVLRELIEKGGFRLILNGLPIQEGDGLKELLNDLYAFPNTEIGICMQDALSIYPEESEVRRIPTQVIFTGKSGVGSVPSVILDYLGEYEYYFPVKGGGKKDPLEFWSSDNWSIGGPTLRKRVRQEDLNDSAVVLKGIPNNQIMLVNRF